MEGDLLGWDVRTLLSHMFETQRCFVVPPTASAQDRLLAYTGRDPS